MGSLIRPLLVLAVAAGGATGAGITETVGANSFCAAAFVGFSSVLGPDLFCAGFSKKPWPEYWFLSSLIMGVTS